MEQWKKIVGYENYEVSNIGRVRNSKTMYILKPQKKEGYNRIGLYNKKFLVHRLVAQAFIPNHENKPCVNHINGVRDDNIVENLEWCTISENNKHMYTLGYKRTFSEETRKKISKALKNNKNNINNNHIKNVKKIKVNNIEFESMQKASMHFGKYNEYFTDVIRRKKQNPNWYKQWEIEIL